jgi:hypothetical protein
MKLVFQKSYLKGATGNTWPCNVHMLVLEINDHQAYAKQMLNEINENAWIEKLNPVAKVTYEKRVARTASALTKIFNDQVDKSKIVSEFGEYMISMSTVACLVEKLTHKPIPLAELWKEKVTGNPGFDFHSEEPSATIVFGEAKYRRGGNAYDSAAKQVVNFVQNEKDLGDAESLENFASETAISNLVINKSRSFTLAFSISSDDYALIFKNASLNANVIKVAQTSQNLFLIGVKS